MKSLPSSRGGKNFYNYIYEVGPNSSSVLHRKIISDLGISDPDSLPPTMPSPQDIAEAYSRAAPEYENARANWDNEALLDSLCSRLPPGSRVLDVGCGSGTPIAEGLVDRGMHVHGIDISEGQINRALSKQIENATFEVKNMLDIDYENEFDGIACFYSIYHIEREHHEEMMTKLAKSLKKDGLAMVLFGVKARAGHVGEIAGASVGWSSHDMKTNLELMEGVGLVIQNVFIDNAGDERHQVVVAKK